MEIYQCSNSMPYAPESGDGAIFILVFIDSYMYLEGHHYVFTILSCFQRNILKYFVSTAEEVFFFFVRNRLNLASLAIKER